MNTSGDAAEQVVRFSLEGMEKVIRISGAGGKELMAMIFAALKDKQQTMGKTNLVNMLKSGKNVKIFSIQKHDLAKFTEETKRYGVLYCALLDKKNKCNDGVIDIMVREEDAPKVNRIVERFNLSIVDTAMLRTVNVKTNDKKDVEDKKLDNNDNLTNTVDTKENIVAEKLGGANEEKVVAYSNEEVMVEILGDTKEKSKNEITLPSKTEKEVPSKHSLKNKEGLEDKTKPSIRKELEEIKKNALLNKVINKSKKKNKKKKNIKEKGG